MKVDFKEGRSVDILVDREKNIVIFPISRSDRPYKMPNGQIREYRYLTAYYPIELKYPYTKEALAEKIQYGIEQWNVHPCYIMEEHGKRTYEAKYYGVRGFKEAVRGKLSISVGWNIVKGKYVVVFAPLKSGYQYIGIDDTKLEDDADWIDFAEVVMKYVNMDVTKLHRFEFDKKSINW